MTDQRTLTPSGIQSILQRLAVSDPRVRTFRLGDFALKDTSSEDEFPMVMFALLDSKIIQAKGGQFINEWNVMLYAFEQRRTDWTNVVDSFSTCHNILSDLVIRFLEDQELTHWGIRQTSAASIDYILYEGRDDVVGCSCRLQFSSPITLSACAGDFPSVQ